jgi:surface adhesion protein
VSGIEGSSISLGSLSAKATGTATGLSSLMVSGAPVGALLTDGHGNSVTITSAGQQVNVLHWNLSSLKITPSNDAPITLTATATETDAAGKTSTANAQETITVAPKAPVLTTAGVSGTEGSAISLHPGVTIGGLPGDNNSLSSLVVSAVYVARPIDPCLCRLSKFICQK